MNRSNECPSSIALASCTAPGAYCEHPLPALPVSGTVEHPDTATRLCLRADRSSRTSTCTILCFLSSVSCTSPSLHKSSTAVARVKLYAAEGIKTPTINSGGTTASVIKSRDNPDKSDNWMDDGTNVTVTAPDVHSPNRPVTSDTKAARLPLVTSATVVTIDTTSTQQWDNVYVLSIRSWCSVLCPPPCPCASCSSSRYEPSANSASMDVLAAWKKIAVYPAVLSKIAHSRFRVNSSPQCDAATAAFGRHLRNGAQNRSVCEPGAPMYCAAGQSAEMREATSSPSAVFGSRLVFVWSSEKFASGCNSAVSDASSSLPILSIASDSSSFPFVAGFSSVLSSCTTSPSDRASPTAVGSATGMVGVSAFNTCRIFQSITVASTRIKWPQNTKTSHRAAAWKFSAQ